MRVIVGMSGGVDSAVAALLLKQAGHDVTGVTMSIWKGDSTIKTASKDACYGPNEKEDIKEAQKICNKLNIPFHVLDCADKYEEIVLKNFRNEYMSGRTPNPCIWCNSRIKFGALPQLVKLSGIEFDKFATGHYARISHDLSNNRYILKRAADERKDQTYFLYRLNQEQLSKIIFPLGDYLKEEVRKIARDNGLDVAEKPESQDFYSGDYNELLNVEAKQGNIVDKNGNILGKHDGIWNYTLGQRKGLGIAAQRPLYVVDLNKETNEVIVGYEEDTYNTTLVATELNWIAFEDIPANMLSKKIKAKIRSSQSLRDACITECSNNAVHIKFYDPQKAITTGQSIVFYDENTVLGGGIISQIL